jgi:putative transcriptional regulator
MSIRVTLDRVLLDRRMSLTELSERVGVTLANLSILKTGKAKAVRFSTLEALCREARKADDASPPNRPGRPEPAAYPYVEAI